MKRFAYLLGGVVLPAFALQPAQVVIQKDPAVNVTIKRNASNANKNISITVNKQDQVLIQNWPAAPPPKPPNDIQTVACPIGSVAGSTWTQTRTYVAAPPPTYWVPGAWVPTVPPTGACPQNPAPPMHGGVHGILWDNPIIASHNTSVGFSPGIDYLALSEPVAFDPPPPLTDWEQPGAVRTVCAPSHHNNDDAIVYPGSPGLAHDHTFFRPGTDAFLNNENVRALGNKSTCRGGIVDLTARWVPTMYDTVSMRAIIPESMIVYYKTTICNYSIPCSGSDKYLAAPLMNVNWVPKGLRFIAGDPGATAATGHAWFSCFDGAGNSSGRQDTIPPCPVGNSMWMTVEFPTCLATDADGKPLLDSPDHKSHASYVEGWPAYNSPLPGKAYRCPPSHPFAIPDIHFNVVFIMLPGMDTTKWNLSCGTNYCGHGDWFDGWDQNIMVQTNVECLQKRRDCGSYRVYTGATAKETGGN
jgi:hypothetical protein